MKNSMKSASYLAIALAAPLFAAPAWAQDARAANSDEIVVTAQRKEEGVLDVPLSIKAMTGGQLAESGISQVSDLQFTTPGFTPSNASGYNQMFIRGIGNSIFVGADPSVATYIDDVPRVFGTTVNNFVNVERVEVIKGAPGGLYGRNATGGAVNIITRQPDPDEFGAVVRLSYGEKQTFRGSAFLNVPLGDNVAWTISGERNSHEPYIKNITPNATAYTAAMFPGGSVLGTAQQTADFMNSGLVARKGYVTEDFWAVSSKLLIEFTDNFKVTFAGDFSEKNDDNGNGLYNYTPGYATAVAANFFDLYLGTNTVNPNGTTTLDSLAVLPTKKFTTAQRGAGFVKLRDYGGSATAVLDLEKVSLTSITSYRENKSRFLTELGFTPINFIAAEVNIDKETFYQEFRAVSDLDGPFQYIAGATYLEAKFDGGLATTLLTPVPFLADLPSGSGRYTVTNWSAYLQLGYDFTENLNLTVSGRYVHEKNDAISFNPITGSQDPFKLVQKRVLPSATLKYSLDGGGNVYARWARGFKAGGIVPVVPTSFFPDPLTQGGAFKGEGVDSFETGVRMPVFNNRGQFTAAVFYNAYRNVQVAAHVDPNFVFAPLVSISVVNAGSARTYGAEATFDMRVIDPVTVGASVGYLNAKYRNFRVPANPVLEGFDLSGRRMINSPEWQLSFHANLDLPITDEWNLIGNALVSYSDDVIWQQSGLAGVLPDAVGPSYWLVNARAGVKSSDDRWELAVYAKNLFNSAYTAFGNSSSIYGNILAWGEPRIVGIEGTFRY